MKTLLHGVRCCIAVRSVFQFFLPPEPPMRAPAWRFRDYGPANCLCIRVRPHGDSMSDEKRIRCPYCQKVFKLKVKPIRDDQKKLNLQCPYCKESLAITREMIASSQS